MRRAEIDSLALLSKERYANTKQYFKRLRKKSPKQLDVVMQELHEDEFDQMDCLTCANCCKTTSPIFTDKDISRIAKHFRMKEGQFTNQYLQRDKEDFLVLKEAPCTFLDESDNTCSIYDVRPKACQEYPHTNRRKFIQLTQLTLENTSVCPAVVNIVEALKKKIPL